MNFGKTIATLGAAATLATAHAGTSYTHIDALRQSQEALTRQLEISRQQQQAWLLQQQIQQQQAQILQQQQQQRWLEMQRRSLPLTREPLPAKIGLGVTIVEDPSGQAGAYVVNSNMRNFQPGDLITRCNGIEINVPMDLVSCVNRIGYDRGMSRFDGIKTNGRAFIKLIHNTSLFQ